MTTIFLICAAVGGAILLLQLALTLIGLGGDGLDLDMDMPDDVDIDFDASVADDIVDTHYDSNWMFGIISFRTLVAACTFFGLSGLIAESADLTLSLQLVLSIAGGAAAMFVVHWIMQTLKNLGQDGTIRIRNTIGKSATVYVPIPANNESSGKVQLKVQDRLMEYEAKTAAGTKLPTGSTVVVTGVVGPNTLEVVPAKEVMETAHA